MRTRSAGLMISILGSWCCSFVRDDTQNKDAGLFGEVCNVYYIMCLDCLLPGQLFSVIKMAVSSFSCISGLW